MRFIILLFTMVFCLPIQAQQGIVANYIRLNPTSLPAICSLGDLRFDSGTDQLVFCDNSNTWAPTGGGSSVTDVTASSPLSSTCGTIPNISLGTVPTNKGGTGQTTASAAFNALSPMTTSGDVIYGGASGAGTRLAKGADGQVLTLASGLPSWADASGGFTNPMTTLGDIMYENATPAAARLAGNTTSTKNFLVQTGTGSVSAAPAWGTIAAGDLPTVTTAKGGTNITSYATGDIIYASATNVLSKRAIGSNGNFLTISGGVPAWTGVSPGTTPPLQTIYTGGMSGNHTITGSPIYMTVTLVGPGGGGQSSNGGTAGTPGSGATTFDIMSGGAGGVAAGAPGGGPGGVASGGDLNVDGQRGSFRATNGAINAGGCGGGTPFGPGGTGGDNTPSAGNPATAPGGGGGGAGNGASGDAASGGGGGGWSYKKYNAPSGSYAYSVGTAGAGGTGGSANGGPAKDGIVIINEYYQ